MRLKKINKGTNEADSNNTWWVFIMHRKQDKSKVTAIEFLL